MIALTFDDGPGALTATTLRTLRAAHARATFFVVGSRIATWPALPAQEAALGAVGDHTWNHRYLPGLVHDARLAELRRTQTVAARASGHPIELFRPPFGGRNHAIDREAHRLGMLQVLWSVDSGDSGGADWREIITNVRAGLRPGAIILFHENRGQTQKALNRLLPEIRRRGYALVSVPELLALDPPTIAQVRSDARGAGPRPAR
jgi:peptidoglycan/xylan/chitin deacetylase (PgdA/CDA1 family)